MNKENTGEILLWMLGAMFVVIAAIRLRLERWLLVRRVKNEVLIKNKATKKPLAINTHQFRISKNNGASSLPFF